MPMDYVYPEYEVVRSMGRCINCRVCEQQCANQVHAFDPKTGQMTADDTKCVNCHRCVAMCPTHALKIVKSDHAFKENGNWSAQTITEVYRQASSGGVLLSSMGNPKEYPVYWDKLLINASQVTNPSIDPLREPMETKTFLGKKHVNIKRDAQGNHNPQFASADGAFHADAVFGYELRLHLVQRAQKPGPSGQTAGHLLQHRRGRPAQGFLPIRPKHHRTGGVRPIWGAQRLPGSGRCH